MINYGDEGSSKLSTSNIKKQQVIDMLDHFYF